MSTLQVENQCSCNLYNGCTEAAPISVIPASIEPELLFEDYVAKRRPVKIDGVLCDSNWNFPTTIDELKKQFSTGITRDKTLKHEVKVEYRATVKDRFGEGIESQMNFLSFLEEMENGNKLLYMTTQDDHDQGESEASRPPIVSQPLVALQHCFPLQPKMTGNLVPANLNLWIGCHPAKTSVAGKSSSGMHHDYHDNLYVLLRGQKEFTLVSPAHHHAMYTVGNAVRIHPNGRVNYEGEYWLVM